MPSNTNGRTSKSVESADVKAIVFNPSEPMAVAVNQYLAARDAQLFGKDFSRTTDWLDVAITKGLKADLVRDALTAYLNEAGYTWVEPEPKRTSVLMMEFAEKNPREAGESDEHYSERYDRWKIDRQARINAERNNADALDKARMQKIKDLIAMGTDITEAFASAMAAYPDGMQIVKSRK